MSTASLADHYRALTDEQLERLFAARPDLAVPVPSDFSVLAQRAHSRMSVARALDITGVDEIYRIVRTRSKALEALGITPG